MFIWKKTYLNLIRENERLKIENKRLAFKLNQYKKYYRNNK